MALFVEQGPQPVLLLQILTLNFKNLLKKLIYKAFSDSSSFLASFAEKKKNDLNKVNRGLK